MNKSKLKEILKRHKMWLEDEEGGEKANLRRVDLDGAELCKANLQGADLRGADLCETILCEANLRGADLREADLRFSNLYRADLREADLRHAYLRFDDLRFTDFGGADLRDSNLGYADLHWANLRGANLSGADLDFSQLNLSCSGLDFKVDERIAKQLVYHALNVMEYSGIEIPKDIIQFANESHVVTEHKQNKIGATHKIKIPQKHIKETK